MALVDGTLSSSESAQLDEIRKELKLKKSVLNAAFKLAQRGEATLKPVGSFVDKVVNLDMMLRVAYSDQDLGEAEWSIIENFSNVVGLQQGQLDRMRSEALSQLKPARRTCPSCRSESDATARFCPVCGASLDVEKRDVQVDLVIPSSGFALTFADSTAAAFPKALQIATTSQGYQSCQRGKKVWHLATFPADRFPEMLPLADCLYGIRNRVLYVDGEETAWDEVFGFTWCAKKRATAFRPIEYCFGKEHHSLNPWGCIQARMEWAEWSEWFSYGKWEEAGMLKRKPVWRFDKQKMKHTLATNLFRFRFCPHLRADLADAVLRHIPDTVVPEVDSDWEFRSQYEERPGSIKVVRQEKSDGYTFRDEFWADGVRPVGLGVFFDILKRAFQDVGLPTAVVNGLLE